MASQYKPWLTIHGTPGLRYDHGLTTANRLATTA